MTRAVWIDEGSFLDELRLREHGIEAVYFSHRDPNVTAALLDDAVNAGFRPGIYSASTWYDGATAVEYARAVDFQLKRIGWKGNAPVCVDIETHDVGYVLAFFREWRRLRPRRATAWTFEGFQGGLFSREAVAELVSRNIRFVPQFYRGDLTPHEHSPIIDLLMSGFPGDRIDGFYDAAALPYRWRGFAFTQARLP